MSDHPKEAEKILKRIFICADICLDVFRWLSPAKVGLELALVSDRFDVLADTHFRSRRWALGNLKLNKSANVKIAKGGPSKILPIAKVPLPDGVIGFDRVKCPFPSSDEVGAFLRRIGRLFQSDIALVLGEYFNGNLFALVWPLLNVSGVVELWCEGFLHRFRVLILPTALCDCANLREITVKYLCPFQFPSDSVAGTYDFYAVSKWLHTPLGDGRPKVLRIICGKIDDIVTDGLKKEFLSATVGVSFILLWAPVYSFYSMSPFELINSLTHEQLAVRKFGDKWLIVRSPIDKNADQWAMWEREAMDKKAPEWKVIEFEGAYESH